HLLELHGLVPVVGGGDFAAVRGHADQHRLTTEGGATELADVELAAPAHGSRGGITDVRIVRPDHRTGVRAAMLQQCAQGVEHVPVAQVPGLGGAAIHGAVIVLGGHHHTGVALGIEEVASSRPMYSRRCASSALSCSVTACSQDGWPSITLWP